MDLPLPRRRNIAGKIKTDFLLAQQISTKMPQRGQFSGNAAPVDQAGEKLLQKFPYILTLHGQQKLISFFQEIRKLRDVSPIAADRMPDKHFSTRRRICQPANQFPMP